MSLCQNRLQEERYGSLSQFKVRSNMKRLTSSSNQKAVASRPPFWILRKTCPHAARNPRFKEVGVWHTREGQDAMGGRHVQA